MMQSEGNIDFLTDRAYGDSRLSRSFVSRVCGGASTGRANTTRDRRHENEDDLLRVGSVLHEVKRLKFESSQQQVPGVNGVRSRSATRLRESRSRPVICTWDAG